MTNPVRPLQNPAMRGEALQPAARSRALTDHDSETAERLEKTQALREARLARDRLGASARKD